MRKANNEIYENSNTDEAHINNALMEKAAWKEHLKEEKRERLRMKRLAREKFEKENCGGYCLVYPFVSYAEEDMISARIEKEQKALIN